MRSGGVLALVALMQGAAFGQDAGGQQPTPGERLDQAIERATTGPWEEQVYVVPMLGSGFGADIDGGSLLFGGAVGYDTGGPFSIEGELGVISGADQAPEFLAADFDTRLVSFMANALWHFDTGRNFRPYASAGLGVQNADVDVEGPNPGLITDESSTEFAWSWGGGFRTSFAERTDFRFDLRYMTGDDAVPSFWRTYAGVSFGIGR
jgi:opacity protein-like surface antigen